MVSRVSVSSFMTPIHWFGCHCCCSWSLVLVLGYFAPYGSGGDEDGKIFSISWCHEYLYHHSWLQFTDLAVVSVVVGGCFSFLASSLRMDRAVTKMVKLSAYHGVTSICIIIHDSNSLIWLVISVVVEPCFSFMASSLRMDQAVTRRA